jgi:hypothetical protein
VYASFPRRSGHLTPSHPLLLISSSLGPKSQGVLCYIFVHMSAVSTLFPTHSRCRTVHVFPRPIRSGEGFAFTNFTNSDIRSLGNPMAWNVSPLTEPPYSLVHLFPNPLPFPLPPKSVHQRRHVPKPHAVSEKRRAGEGRDVPGPYKTTKLPVNVPREICTECKIRLSSPSMIPKMFCHTSQPVT